MCGRYYIDELDDAADEAFASFVAEARVRAEKQGLRMTAHGEVRPTDVAPVLATNALNRAIGAFPMRWGFTHPSRGMLVFNTRSETANEKPLFVTSTEDRRCLIPASRYYEWQKDGQKKIRYAFGRHDGAPLYLGGLYLRQSGNPLPSFTILTRDAPEGIRHIHARMPLVIPAARMQEWLSPACAYGELLDSAVTDVAFTPA